LRNEESDVPGGPVGRQSGDQQASVVTDEYRAGCRGVAILDELDSIT
jgi:hypothetical protein